MVGVEPVMPTDARLEQDCGFELSRLRVKGRIVVRLMSRG